MPIDPANPATLIIEGKDHFFEVTRLGDIIYIHTQGRTLGLDEDMAANICDGLQAILLKHATRVISRGVALRERRLTPTDIPTPEDL
jgi:hypothetical protein